ncbi:hypothetical protein H310_11576 [Aphanomyces invadans]|uniref:Uncharacterized protein n=1 Tax=Aphanomyces invadans TaxID=157072 RepID=A0A024TLC3_9STRA|nr:hypothetical protein H310_11576 [Aphanomyces invadans]ETV94930.1 hypothetical protein H310_11576 [Aphanomyces invadans]|eukprot:XP_008876521.1 hypothetical protein H310_11576 [Aphanomyces invadans]
MATFVVTSLPSDLFVGPVSPVDRITAKSPNHAAFVDPKKELKRVRSVGFEGADIVEFEPTIFTTTVTSGGVPVGLSNMERRRIRRRLDSFELERKDERVCRQNYMEEGYLDPDERATILGNAGCEASSFETVEAELNLIIAHRRESNEMDVQCIYGLGEYGMEDSEVPDAVHDDDADSSDDEGLPGPSPFHSTYFATTADTTHEWRQTLDIIARTDMHEHINNIDDHHDDGGVWTTHFRLDRCQSTTEESTTPTAVEGSVGDAMNGCFLPTCDENFSDQDLSSTDLGDASGL